MSVASEYLEVTKVSADQLVRTHAPLVRRIAYHLMGRLPPSVDANDLMQASIIMASFVYNTAMRDEMLPRKPLPKKK